jgi:protein-L-isoaspartate O-methyltransferase
MDAKTIEVYDSLGSEFSERYRSGRRVSLDRIKEAFSGCSRILEVGTGSGIDFSRLLEAGFDMTGMEPSETFIQEAYEHFPETKGRIFKGSLPLNESFKQQWNAHYDAVFCSAVFMHIPVDRREVAMCDLAGVLRSKGRMYFHISEYREGLDKDNRDEFGRLYVPMNRAETLQLMKSAGFRIIQQWEDDDKWHRRGLSWVGYLLEKAE